MLIVMIDMIDLVPRNTCKMKKKSIIFTAGCVTLAAYVSFSFPGIVGSRFVTRLNFGVLQLREIGDSFAGVCASFRSRRYRAHELADI